MILFRSIKWQLQLWHGVILLLVLGGFGYTAFDLQRTREFRRIDEQLHEYMNVVLRPARPMRRLRGPRPFEPAPDRGPLARSPDQREREPGLDAPPEGPPEPPAEAEMLFPEKDAFYYRIWAPNGRVLRRGGETDVVTPRPSVRAGIHMRGPFRELLQFTPRGEAVLVGRSIARELSEMRRLALVLLALGGGILGVGLAGGWVAAGRAMRPIDSISEVAVKIASGDLSLRIPQREAESELGRLISVLNSSFARLDAAFAEQVRFTTDVSHELRTPVSVIVSQTQMALARERPAAEYRESIEACQRAAQRMRGLIESLLQLARLDAGQEPLNKSEFDLGKVAADCIQMLEPLAAERRVQIISELAPVRCVGDSERIAQVITNLLTNAIRYTPEQGQARVATRLEHGLAVLVVSDTGMGIPAEDLSRVFDRFYRVEQSRSREKGGSGLGLAISRAIVNAHGGTIEAESVPNYGATFTVRIPAM